MRKKNIAPYLILTLILLGGLSVSKKLTNPLRARSVSVVTHIKPHHHPRSSEYVKLKAENKRLKEHLEGISDWLLFDQRLERQLDRLEALADREKVQLPSKDFIERRKTELSNLLTSQMQSCPANIIHRDPVSWSSSFWIDVGSNDNAKLGGLIVARNSPVIANGCIVGVVEQVEKDKARVRLITDSGLICAVRAVRGERQALRLYDMIEQLSDNLAYSDELFVSEEEKTKLLEVFSKLENRLLSSKEDSYLAKGEIRGGSVPIFRSKSSSLIGIGFNYDFSDCEGMAKDLISGRDIDQKEGLFRPLIKKGDMLVSSGLDGVFPPGLDVAVVSKVFPLNEGDFSYELQAKPAAGHLDDLKVVFVLPPITQ